MNQQERDAIAAIEKQIGERLKQRSPDDDISISRNEYKINEKGDVIYLNLGGNNINDISSLKGLTNLTALGLHNNQINDVSPLKGLAKLTALYLIDNNINELPEWFLNWNLKIKLDWSIGNGIFVGGNPLTSPPIEIIKDGNDAILNYFKQIKEDSDYIYEAKLILVGEGGSGKTSLANKIIDPTYPLEPENESESTRGIDILRYEFPFKDKKFRVNIWDFGGQQIYHQTHQFFLTKRSLYLLLADNRKEDGDFYYWLNTVSMLSEDSPLLIIKNEKGDRQRQLPEDELRAEFNNLKESLATNLKDNRGLDIVINKIR